MRQDPREDWPIERGENEVRADDQGTVNQYLKDMGIDVPGGMPMVNRYPDVKRGPIRVARRV